MNKLDYNICYLDLNDDGMIEDYGEFPNKYGGGAIVGRAFLKRFTNFDIYGNEACFENVRGVKKLQTFPLTLAARQALKKGAPVKNFIPDADKYDLFVHHDTAVHLNLESCRSPKQCMWPIGWHENVNQANKHLLVFDPQNQEVQLSSPNHVIHKVVIGPPAPEFQHYNKEDIIFNCCRATAVFQMIQVAQLCLKYGIQGVFAGPIDNQYPFKDFIDGKTTHYLGVIDQETKIKYNKLSKFHCQFQTYPISVTLSGKEALSYGVPIMATPVGGWRSFIQNGVNGFIINSEQDFLNAWDQRDNISQRACYDSMLGLSEDEMVKTFSRAFGAVINNY